MTSKKLILIVITLFLVFFITGQPIDAADHFGGSENTQESHSNQTKYITLGTNSILIFTSLALIACASFLFLIDDKITEMRKRRYIERHGLPKIEIEDVISKYPRLRNKIEKTIKESKRASDKETKN